MNLLETVLSLFLGEKSKDLTPLLENLFKNGFDLKSALSSVDVSGLISTVLPLFVSPKPEPTFTSQSESRPLEFDLKTLAGEEIFTLLTAENVTT